MDGHYYGMKWHYFQALKNIRSTARKALNFFWLNAQHSEVFKMLCYALIARLESAQIRLKVTKNLLFSPKMTENEPFLLKKANSSELSDDFAEELDVLKDHNRPF